MDNKSYTAKAVIAVCALLALLFIGIFCYRSGMKTAETAYLSAKPTITAATVKQHIIGIQEFATAEYNYTNIGQFENTSDFYGLKVPFSTKKFIVSYDGTIKAGIDFSSLEINISENEIVLKIPEAYILSHEIDESSLEIYDEKNGIFNKITLEDYNKFQIEQKEIMEEKAIENGMLEKAYNNASYIIKNMLLSSFSDYGYDIKIYKAE